MKDGFLGGVFLFFPLLSVSTLLFDAVAFFLWIYFFFLCYISFVIIVFAGACERVCGSPFQFFLHGSVVQCYLKP